MLTAEEILKYLQLAEPIILKKVKDCHWKTPLFVEPEDIQQELRLFLFKRLRQGEWDRAKSFWKNGFKSWVRLKIRHRLFELYRIEKKELVRDKNGYVRRGEQLESDINQRSLDKNWFENRAATDKNEQNKFLLLKIDFEKAMENISLSKQNKDIFNLQFIGFSPAEIGQMSGKKVNNIRNIIWCVRAKIKRYFYSPYHRPKRMDREESEKRNTEIKKLFLKNPNISFSELGFRYDLSIKRIKQIIGKRPDPIFILKILEVLKFSENEVSQLSIDFH